MFSLRVLILFVIFEFQFNRKFSEDRIAKDFSHFVLQILVFFLLPLNDLAFSFSLILELFSPLPFLFKFILQFPDPHAERLFFESPIFNIFLEFCVLLIEFIDNFLHVSNGSMQIHDFSLITSVQRCIFLFIFELHLLLHLFHVVIQLQFHRNLPYLQETLNCALELLLRV